MWVLGDFGTLLPPVSPALSFPLPSIVAFSMVVVLRRGRMIGRLGIVNRFGSGRRSWTVGVTDSSDDGLQSSGGHGNSVVSR